MSLFIINNTQYSDQVVLDVLEKWLEDYQSKFEHRIVFNAIFFAEFNSQYKCKLAFERGSYYGSLIKVEYIEDINYMPSKPHFTESINAL